MSLVALIRRSFQRPWFPPLILVAGTWLMYGLFPFPGFRRWDSLMTATVLHQWDRVGLRQIFYFAHTLVIPATRIVALIAPRLDPLVVVSLRETLLAGVNTALLYGFLRQVTGLRSGAFVMALASIFLHGRWLLVTHGEEKEMLLLLQLLLLRWGWLCLRETSAGRTSPALRSFRWEILGALMALAVAVHLENGLMVLTLAMVLVRDSFRKKFPWNILIRTGGTAFLLALAWFAWLIVGVNHIHTGAGAWRWLMEYHVTGEFFNVNPHLDDQALEAWKGFRRLLMGAQGEHGLLGLELMAGLTLTGLTVVRSWRRDPRSTTLALIFLGMMTLHFFYWLPWDPEQWLPVIPMGSVLILNAWGTFGRRFETLLFALTLVLAIANGLDWRREDILVRPYRVFHHQRNPAPASFSSWSLRGNPYYHLIQGLQPELPAGARVLVAHRHLANYLWLYTDTVPVVPDYLDRSEAELIQQEWLSILSLTFYRSRDSSVDLRRMIRTGSTPVLYLADRDGPDPYWTDRLEADAVPVPLARVGAYSLWRLVSRDRSTPRASPAATSHIQNQGDVKRSRS